MSATIIQFKLKDGTIPKENISISELIDNIKETVFEEWVNSSNKNRLNEYIHSKLSSLIRPDTVADYANDLNVISLLEQKLKMNVLVFSPGTTKVNLDFWLSSMQIDDIIITSAQNMHSECAARAFNIVVFSILRNRMRK